MNVEKVGKVFQTSSYQKPTSTGLGLQFDSAVTSKYKFNLIQCLLDRAYKINSTYKNLCKEFDYLRGYFAQNGFNQFTVEKFISKKLNSTFTPLPDLISVPKQTIYSKIPYFSHYLNKQLNSDIVALVSKFFPQIDLRLIFTNDRSIQSFFRFKDDIPISVRSNIVYQYTCRICNSTYIGETVRHFKTRVAEHRGLSSRTGFPLKSSSKSNIFCII